MRSLYDVHKINSYRTDHFCLYIHIDLQYLKKTSRPHDLCNWKLKLLMYSFINNCSLKSILASSLQNSEFSKNACVYSGIDYTFPVLLFLSALLPGTN
jgi:hypothetical protein